MIIMLKNIKQETNRLRHQATKVNKKIRIFLLLFRTFQIKCGSETPYVHTHTYIYIYVYISHSSHQYSNGIILFSWHPNTPKLSALSLSLPSRSCQLRLSQAKAKEIFNHILIPYFPLFHKPHNLSSSLFPSLSLFLCVTGKSHFPVTGRKSNL